MTDQKRRRVLKAIGASSIFAASSIGATTASETEYDIEKIELSSSEEKKYSREAFSNKAVEEMVEFLREEKSEEILKDDLDGYRVQITGDEEINPSEYVLLTTTINDSGDEVFTIQVIEGDVYVTAIVDGSGYKSNLETIDSDNDLSAQEKNPEGYNVVDSLEWNEYQEKKTDNNQIIMQSGMDCVRSFTFNTRVGTDDIPQWLCTAVAGAGGLVLTLLPEPGSTAGGVGVITLTATSTGCVVTHEFDDDSDIDLSDGVDITICLEAYMDCDINSYPPKVDCSPDLSAYVSD
ncbi:hypothetical protein [Natrarchaeobaculum sulfurireducens]|uniref:hypothetical protein n=1 Tax=Natrarchaeobaculum sulfurireducens TaxID=2044521 RepID=UPI00105AB0C1|nr:hypothetical protein [Natrarchaeobaculum sulfurireducens]